MTEGRLEAIWLKRARRGSMDAVDHATLTLDRGLVGNADQGGRRQVCIIEREVWERLMEDIGATLEPSVRRANLLVSGIRLQGSRGLVLSVGGCRIRVRGELTPCERMDEAWPGLQAAMRPDWRGGIYGQVIGPGEIRVGDPVVLRAPTPDELGDPGDLRIVTRVNGIEKQNGNTRDMTFDVASIIEILSLGMTLEAGDIVATGTPPGMGHALTPPEYLRPGDEVEVEIERIGTIKNRVVES